MSGHPSSVTGHFLVVVGPDGVGKSTVCDAVLAASPAPAGYFHFRPPLRGPLPARVPAEVQPRPKFGGRPGRVSGWLRVAVALIRFWASYLSVIRPMVRSGGVVVGDRWAYGYLVQPGALRFAGPEWLARALLFLLPRPDLVVNLTAPPAVIVSRKQELAVEEIERELINWAKLPNVRLVTIDARSEPSAIAASVWKAIRP